MCRKTMNECIPLNNNRTIFNAPFPLFGVAIWNRMITVALPGNTLWVPSPIQLNSDIITKLRALVDASGIGLPTLFHCLHVHGHLFNLAHTSAWSKWVSTWYGIKHSLMTSKLFNSCMKNLNAFKQAIQTIVSWAFNSIILSHGDVIIRGGKDRFIQAFDWLLTETTP